MTEEATARARPADSASVQSVDRALTVLQLLASDEELGVTEIARRLGVHKSTAFRLVSTLESHGLVEQLTDSSRYRLGMGILRLAGATQGRLDVVRESRPYTSALAERVGETVNVVILAGTETLYLDQVSGPSTLQTHNWTGRRNPLHATANGRVLLAALPLREREAMIARLLDQNGSLGALTPRTPNAPDELRRRLNETLDMGYAVSVDELEEGLTAIAAPVRDGSGEVVASVSLSGPSFRLPAERIHEVVSDLLDTAARVSAGMGYRPPTAGSLASR